MLASLGTLGQGLSVMQDRMQAAKSFEQEQKDREDERAYLAQYRPKTLQAQDQTLERGKLGIEDDKLKLEGSQKLKAARDALDAQVAGEWSFVAPEDAGNVMGWKAELATLNREGNKAIAPQDYYRLKKESMAEDKRKQGKYESEMETEAANRQKGSYTPYVLNGNALGAFNTRTGEVRDTGETAQAKLGGRHTEIVQDGSTLIPDLKPIEGVQITKDSVKKVKDGYAGLVAFKNQLADYKSLIEKGGTEAMGEDADRLDAMQTDLGMKLKNLQDLGVLNGQDWALMQKQIPAAAGVGAKAKAIAYGAIGQNSVLPRLGVLEKSMDDKWGSFIRSNGFELAEKPQSKFKILSVE